MGAGGGQSRAGEGKVAVMVGGSRRLRERVEESGGLGQVGRGCQCGVGAEGRPSRAL